MAIKNLIDKFKKKFSWDGRNFRSLIVNIFAKGRKTIENKVMQDTFTDWKKQEKKLGKIELPKVDDFLSSNAKLVKLANINSKEVTETLKQKMIGDLKRAIEDNKAKGIFKKGNLLNDDTINSFKNNLRETFKGYVEKDGMKAGKLEQIALTESRNIVNPLKYEYAIKVSDNNPDMEVIKEWQHYPWKSKEPRKGHREKNKEKISIRDLYRVNYYAKGKGGELILKGFDYMKFPHDPDVGARQNVSCHCDIRFNVKRTKK